MGGARTSARRSAGGRQRRPRTSSRSLPGTESRPGNASGADPLPMYDGSRGKPRVGRDPLPDSQRIRRMIAMRATAVPERLLDGIVTTTPDARTASMERVDGMGGVDASAPPLVAA